MNGLGSTAASAAALATVALALSVSGCGGDDDAYALDGGPVRDAMIVEAGPPQDGGGAWWDGAAADGAPSRDAATSTCTTTPCDPRVPGSCGGAGLCVLASAEPECTSSVGSAARGAPCESTADCARGLACFLTRGEGRCGEPCCPGSDASCGAEERCGVPGILVEGVATPFYRCVGSRPCDVFEPSAVCEEGEACYIVDPDGTTDCRPAGAGESGAACADQSDCAPGFFCGGLTMPTCVRICELRATSGERACPADEGMCRAYSHTPDGAGLCTL